MAENVPDGNVEKAALSPQPSAVSRQSQPLPAADEVRVPYVSWFSKRGISDCRLNGLFTTRAREPLVRDYPVGVYVGASLGISPSIGDNLWAELLMSNPTLAPELVRRYLAALGVPQREPSIDALRELVAAHLTRVPFENISKLHNRKHHGLTTLPPIELYLDGIQRYHFGGTCYSNNFHFYTLLTALGYDVKLCGADMTHPDVHLVILATLDSHEYLVDAGYGAPFLAPLPRDLTTDYVIALGRDRYVLKPQDSSLRSRLEIYRDGQPLHGYLVKPAPRRIEEFAQVIADSFRPSATFLNALLLVRFYPDRALLIHNLTLVESHGSESAVHQLGSCDELVAKVADLFGMPRAIVAEVVSELGELQDVWT